MALERITRLVFEQRTQWNRPMAEDYPAVFLQFLVLENTYTHYPSAGLSTLTDIHAAKATRTNSATLSACILTISLAR